MCQGPQSPSCFTKPLLRFARSSRTPCSYRSLARSNRVVRVGRTRYVCVARRRTGSVQTTSHPDLCAGFTNSAPVLTPLQRRSFPVRTRDSTDGQSVDVQVRQLRAAGCERIFREGPSGARGHRSQLQRALGRLAAGDLLMATRLDRLAPEARAPRASNRPSRSHRPYSAPRPDRR
jgi:hypothetical protein